MGVMFDKAKGLTWKVDKEANAPAFAQDRGTREMAEAVMRHVDVACARLYASGIAIDRMCRWSEWGRSYVCGVLVDGLKACTVSICWRGLVADVTTVWHSPFAYLAELDEAGDDARIAELRKLVGE